MSDPELESNDITETMLEDSTFRTFVKENPSFFPQHVQEQCEKSDDNVDIEKNSIEF